MKLTVQSLYYEDKKRPNSAYINTGFRVIAAAARDIIGGKTVAFAVTETDFTIREIVVIRMTEISRSVRVCGENGHPFGKGSQAICDLLDTEYAAEMLSMAMLNYITKTGPAYYRVKIDGVTNDGSEKQKMYEIHQVMMGLIRHIENTFSEHEPSAAMLTYIERGKNICAKIRGEHDQEIE